MTAPKTTVPDGKPPHHLLLDTAVHKAERGMPWTWQDQMTVAAIAMWIDEVLMQMNAMRNDTNAQ